MRYFYSLQDRHPDDAKHPSGPIRQKLISMMDTDANLGLCPHDELSEIPAYARHKKMGFTLIEVILVIIIMGLIATVGVPLIYEASKSQTTATNLANVISQSEYALQQMSRKIRQINSNSSSGITSSTASDMTFIMANGKSVRYRLSGTNLEVITAEGTGTLATGVSSLAFSYYDSAGAVTSTVTDMRYIKVDMTVSIGSDGSLPLQSIVYLRNSR